MSVGCKMAVAIFFSSQIICVYNEYEQRMYMCAEYAGEDWIPFFSLLNYFLMNKNNTNHHLMILRIIVIVINSYFSKLNVFFLLHNIDHLQISK